MHVTSPVAGDDWPQLTFSGRGHFRPIIAILKTIPSELRNWDPETKIWSAQPDQLKVRLDEIKALSITIKGHRPAAPELADACLIAFGGDDQIDGALGALDGVIDPDFYAELLAARDRRRELAQ